MEDFLPSPEEPAFKEESVKVTIGLSTRSVQFFKRQARKHHTQYQKMIRRLVDQHAAYHEKLQCSVRHDMMSSRPSEPRRHVTLD